MFMNIRAITSLTIMKYETLITQNSKKNLKRNNNISR